MSSNRPPPPEASRRGPSRSASTRLLALLLPCCAVGVALWWWQHPRHRDAPPLDAPGLRINVNTADAATLTLLPGVGPGVAENIIAHRDRRGPFQNLSDLEQVRLIGPATIEKIAPWVEFGELGNTSDHP